MFRLADVARRRAAPAPGGERECRPPTARLAESSPPAATPAPLVRHRQSRERRGLVRHQMALSIVAVNSARRGGHPSGPGLPQFLPYNRKWSNPGPPGCLPPPPALEAKLFRLSRYNKGLRRRFLLVGPSSTSVPRATKEHSLSSQRTFIELSKNFQRTFKKLSKNFQRTFKELSKNIQRTFIELSEKIPKSWHGSTAS